VAFGDVRGRGAEFRLRVAGHAGLVRAQVTTFPVGSPPTAEELPNLGYSCEEPPDVRCQSSYTRASYGRDADGTLILIRSTYQDNQVVMHVVQVYRPDGTLLLLATSNIRSTEGSPSAPSGYTIEGPEPPVTVDQLIEIGRTPGLTLYPYASPCGPVTGRGRGVAGAWPGRGRTAASDVGKYCGNRDRWC